MTQVQASDGDDGINGQVRYDFVTSVTNPNEDWLKFSLDPETGVITTNAAMDREAQHIFFVSSAPIFLDIDFHFLSVELHSMSKFHIPCKLLL